MEEEAEAEGQEGEGVIFRTFPSENGVQGSVAVTSVCFITADVLAD